MNELNRANRARESRDSMRQPLNDISNTLTAFKSIEPVKKPFDTKDERDKHIKQSVEIYVTSNLFIGDLSNEHILPGKPSGSSSSLYYSITPETLVDVLDGKYGNQIDEYVIIDARYPYEYENGHIRQALNLFNIDQLIRKMFLEKFNSDSNPKLHQFPTCSSSNCLVNLENNSGSLSCMIHSQSCKCMPRQVEKELKKRVIVIFHCEFSSHRGPKLLGKLRALDRNLNSACYPSLYYPELYLLEGGYKNFFEKLDGKNCYPAKYKQMHDLNYKQELLTYEKEVKYWEKVYKDICK